MLSFASSALEFQLVFLLFFVLCLDYFLHHSKCSSFCVTVFCFFLMSSVSPWVPNAPQFVFWHYIWFPFSQVTLLILVCFFSLKVEISPVSKPSFHNYTFYGTYKIFTVFCGGSSSALVLPSQPHQLISSSHTHLHEYLVSIAFRIFKIFKSTYVTSLLSLFY